MIFERPQKLKESEERRRGCENKIGTGTVGERRVLPEEFLEFAKSSRFIRVCNQFGTPCPLRAGGGGSMGYRLFRRPPICLFTCLGFWIMSLWFCVWGVGLWFCVLCLCGLKVCDSPR